MSVPHRLVTAAVLFALHLTSSRHTASAAETCKNNVPENGALTLSCNPGEVISQVLYAGFGANTGSCSPQNSLDYAPNCLSGSSFNVLNQACLGMNSCNVSATSQLFRDSCQNIKKSLSANVRCSKGNACGQTDSGNTLRLQCPLDGYVIHRIDFASYGNPSGSCDSNFKTGSVHAENSRRVAETHCLGRSGCFLKATDSVFGFNGDSKEAKSLAVKASCVKRTTCGFAAKDQTLTLSCPSPNQVISKVKFASYGSPTGDCGSLGMSNTCHAPNSLQIVNDQCLGKPSCSLLASSKTFGADNCPDADNRRLKVQVECSTQYDLCLRGSDRLISGGEICGCVSDLTPQVTLAAEDIIGTYQRCLTEGFVDICTSEAVRKLGGTPESNRKFCSCLQDRIAGQVQDIVAGGTVTSESMTAWKNDCRPDAGLTINNKGEVSTNAAAGTSSGTAAKAADNLDADNQKSSLSTGGIAAIVSGCFLGAALIALTAFHVIKKKRGEQVPFTDLHTDRNADASAKKLEGPLSTSSADFWKTTPADLMFSADGVRFNSINSASKMPGYLIPSYLQNIGNSLLDSSKLPLYGAARNNSATYDIGPGAAQPQGRTNSAAFDLAPSYLKNIGDSLLESQNKIDLRVSNPDRYTNLSEDQGPVMGYGARTMSSQAMSRCIQCNKPTFNNTTHCVVCRFAAGR